jgi:hypothetical protein
MDDGALVSAPLPSRVVFLWSSRDTAFPAGAYAPAVARLEAISGATVLDTGSSSHVASASDPTAAEALVAALLPPPAAPAPRGSRER